MVEQGPGNYDHYEELEIDLREYIQLLWRAKWFIAGLFVLAVVAAFVLSNFVMTPEYESEMVFYAPNFELVSGDELNREDYRSFAYRSEVLREIYEQADLAEGTFRDLENKLTIEGEDGENILLFRLVDSDPETARTLLSLWGESFQAEVLTYLEDKNQEYLRAQEEIMSEREETYQEARSARNEFWQENNLELLASRLNRKENRLVRLEEEIVEIESELDTAQVEQDKLSEQLGNTEQFLLARDTISPENLERLRNLVDNPEVISLMETRREELNPLHIELMENYSSLERRLSTGSRQLEIYRGEVERLEREVNELKQEVTELQDREAELEERVEITEENYRSSVYNFSETEQELARADYPLNIVNEAQVPTSPAAPNTTLNMAIAGVLALMLGVFIVFFREFMQMEDEEE